MTAPHITSIIEGFKPHTARTGSGMSLCHGSGNISMIGSIEPVRTPRTGSRTSLGNSSGNIFLAKDYVKINTDGPDGVLNTTRVHGNKYYLSSLSHSDKIFFVYMAKEFGEGVRAVRGIWNASMQEMQKERRDIVAARICVKSNNHAEGGVKLQPHGNVRAGYYGQSERNTNVEASWHVERTHKNKL